MKKPDGQVTEHNREMVELTLEFYKDPNRSEGTEELDNLLETVPRKVTEEMNSQLDATLKRRFFNPTKAPEPDGFLAHFFRNTGTYVWRRHVWSCYRC